MNKKFLSAILFGALMVTSTGTFVSCKDYDDDIENLQTQIDKLATKEDMTSQIASLQSALSAAAAEASAAKTAAQNALDKATASEKAAAQAALDAAAAKTEAIKAAQEEVAKVKAELEASVDAKFEANKKELAATIAKLTEKVEELTGYTTEMLTGLQIQNVSGYSPAMNLNYATVKIVYPEGLAENGKKKYDKTSWVFGEGMTGAFTLKNGDVNTTKSTILVKADPVNAVIAAENLSLINTKNVDVDDYVTYSANPYTGLLRQNQSRSAIGGTGLYAVGVQLKKNMTSEDFEKFDKLVISGNNHAYNVDQCDGNHNYYKYALAVNDYAKERSVTTGWDITMHVKKEQKAENIDSNSYLYSSARHANKVFTDNIFNYNNSTANDNASDMDEWAFPVVKDEAFELEVGSTGGRVMASYVVVDYDNELLSVTDKAALKGITVSGVNNVTTDNYHALTVSGTYATGVPVPLKLVTVDYTGNIEVNVFWVKAGEPALMTAAFSVTPSTNVANPTAWVAESTMEEFKIPAGATKYTLEFVVGETNHQNATNFKEANTIAKINNGVLNLYESDKITKTTDVSKVAYAKFVGALNLQVMREDKAYEGQIKFYNATGTFLGANNITVKKVLPTTIPAGLSAKENAINNGVLTVYPIAVEGKGEFALANAFNFENGLANDVNLSFNAPSLTDWPYYASFTDRKIVNIPASIISADAKFPTTVVYNYGDIKYHPEGHGVSEPDDCKVTWATTFDIKFNCYPVDCTYSWFNTPVVYYKESVVLDGHARKADGTITEKRNVIKVLDPYAKEVNAFSTVEDNPWLIWAQTLNTYSIELWTNGDKTKVNEFHTAAWAFDNANGGKVVINLTKQSTDVVLSGDVEISVMIKIQDKFTDHVHYVPALKYTMKKDHVVAE